MLRQCHNSYNIIVILLSMDSMLFPTFSVIASRGMMPCIRLPRDYRNLVPLFYAQGRKEDVIGYCDSLAQLLRESSFAPWVPVHLQWDDTRGLTSIGVGTSAGLDLAEQGWPCFQEHNLGT